MKKLYFILLIAVILCGALLLVGCNGDEPPVDTVDEGTLREDGTRVYKVPNPYFTFEKYEVVSKGPTDIGDNFSVFSSNVLEIHASCAASLDSVIAIIKMYDSSGKLVGNYRATAKNCNIAAREGFVLTANISNDAKENFDVIDVRFEGESLNRLSIAGGVTYNVTYVYNNGTPANMAVVKLGDSISVPEQNPEKDGYIFDGWYIDPECKQPYDFENSEVDSDVTLYAGYDLNYIRMGQKIMDMAKLTSVKITTKSYSSLLWGAFETSSVEKKGEGVIIRDDSGRYHVLTTNDMLSKDAKYDKVEYRVEDYYGNVYVGTVKHSSETYNLGILSFEKTSALLVSKLASASPEVEDEVAILKENEEKIYHPNFGKVIGFEKINHENSGSSAKDVSFNMMLHDADTDVRVSGRPMFNMNMELVGIQCGTLTEEKVELQNNHVIPWEAIQKYVNTYDK